MTRVLILTADSLTNRMAGPAIRAWEMASELANRHEVRLVSVRGVPVERSADAFWTGSVHSDRELRRHARWAEVIVVQGTVTSEYAWLLRSPARIVADLYDPMHLELLEQAKTVPIGLRSRYVASTNALLNAQIQRADFMMCASVKQRDFWLGQLAANGRVNPSTYGSDGLLGNLLAVVPFGLPADDSAEPGHAIRGVIDGIEADDEVIIWGGGIYNWFDPVTLVEAMATVASARPSAKLFFMGSGHPNPDVPQMAAAAQARERAEALGLLGRSVFFNEGWVPYEERAGYLRDAAIGVSMHNVHLETEFSFRTRILDYLWCGLPMVVTEGDGFAELIEQEGLGEVVPERNPAAIASALLELLEDPQRYRAIKSRVRDVAEDFSWPRVLAPLVAFCDEPHEAADFARRGQSVMARSPLARQFVMSLRYGFAARPLKLSRRALAGLRSLVRRD